VRTKEKSPEIDAYHPLVVQTYADSTPKTPGQVAWIGGVLRRNKLLLCLHNMSKQIAISIKSSTAISKPLSSKSANLDLQTLGEDVNTTILIKPTSKVRASRDARNFA
jgi:hypothetical protein